MTTGTIFFLPFTVLTFYSDSVPDLIYGFISTGLIFYSRVCFKYSPRMVEPYFFSMIYCFSKSLILVPRTPGLKWKNMICPSIELANKILPLKAQVISDTPILKLSKITEIGLFIYGFQTEIVESMLAIATML